MVYVCFPRLLEATSITTINSINRSVFVMHMRCVFYEVGTAVTKICRCIFYDIKHAVKDAFLRKEISKHMVYRPVNESRYSGITLRYMFHVPAD